MGAKAIPGLMPRPRIVNRDPGCRGKAGAQHPGGSGTEGALLCAQQAHDLPLGDSDAQTVKLGGQARDGNLSLAVLV